ncbi:MAG: hypothetical protein MUC87_20890 [Bacteroidia bacterium]|jgi:ElaB/YqjD/DUF883 family membrane-anchored ribosome-binding protein|nr:hypothetical protein [Bacteroidia bacterium]
MKRDWEGILENGDRYNRYFQTPPGVDETVKVNAKLDDTLAMFPVKVKEFYFQAEAIAKKVLADPQGNVLKTCFNIWNFLTKHLAYVPDEDGKEQVRSTWRLWADRKGDCDCYSFFTSCVLTQLRIPHFFRITEYDPDDGFQHIYVVVPQKGQKDIVIDAVLKYFNYEVPYTKKIDQDMNLNFLNGVPGAKQYTNRVTAQDIQELKELVLFQNPAYFERKVREGLPESELNDLIKYLPEDYLQSLNGVGDKIRNVFQSVKDKVQNTVNTVKDKVQQTANIVKDKVQNAGDKIQDAGRKVISAAKTAAHKINRVNPATTAIRLGVLQGLKLNVFQISEKLRYAYLSNEAARKLGVNEKRFSRYQKTRERLEKYFYTIGGDVANLKEAILTGRGNMDKAVSLNGFAEPRYVPGTYSPITEIIGRDMYDSEVPAQAPELAGLGIVETAAAAAAGSSILAIIAGILKNIGPLMEKGEPGADAEMDALDKAEADATSGSASGSNAADTSNTSASVNDQGAAEEGGAASGSNNRSTSFDWKEFYEKHKPAVIAGALLLVGGIAYLIVRAMSKSSGKSKGKSQENLSGTGSREPQVNGTPDGYSTKQGTKSANHSKATHKRKYKGGSIQEKAEEELTRELRMRSLR